MSPDEHQLLSARILYMNLEPASRNLGEGMNDDDDMSFRR
jgi:hypothetical protein